MKMVPYSEIHLTIGMPLWSILTHVHIENDMGRNVDIEIVRHENINRPY